MCTGRRRAAAFEFACQLFASALRDGPIEVSERRPLDVDELDGAVDGIAEQQRALWPRVENDDRGSGSVPGGELRVDPGDDGAVAIEGFESSAERLQRRGECTGHARVGDEVFPVERVAADGG